MPTKTITPAQYATSSRHGHAGLATERLPEVVEMWRHVYTDWDGKHWLTWSHPIYGTCLTPVNIR